VQRDAFRACQLGFTAGLGWSLLAFPDGVPRWVRQFFAVAWIVGLMIPVGLCARRRAVLWAGAALFAGLAVAPAFVGLEPTPAPEWLAGVVGAWLGMGVRARYSTALRTPAHPGGP
jgi:hypothetical protein